MGTDNKEGSRELSLTGQMGGNRREWPLRKLRPDPAQSGNMAEDENDVV